MAITKTTVLLDIRDKITEKLQKEGRTLRWLSKTTEINYNTLYGILYQKTTKLSPDKIVSINEALGTEFTED